MITSVSVCERALQSDWSVLVSDVRVDICKSTRVDLGSEVKMGRFYLVLLTRCGILIEK